MLPTFDNKAIERTVNEHWEKVNLLQLIQIELDAQNSPVLGFIEGPPTMNGDI